MSRKYYLVDTENVGDRWFDIPRKIRKKDRIVTFYTEHHSKHLEKYLIKQVHNPKILWLECATGNNALDYQLMGVLSYLIEKHPKASFCIYSNDKGYQAAVDFWTSRGIKVCQKGFEVPKKKKAKKEKAKKKKEVLPASSREKMVEKGNMTEEQYVTKIARSVPVSDLGSWYHALTAILGQERGRDWYLKIRDDAKIRAAFSKHYKGDKDSRGVNLVATVLKRHDLDVANAEDAYRIIQSHNPKNIKAIKADFDKKFGKNPSQKYYKVLRPLFRVIKGK